MHVIDVAGITYRKRRGGVEECPQATDPADQRFHPLDRRRVMT